MRMCVCVCVLTTGTVSHTHRQKNNKFRMLKETYTTTLRLIITRNTSF